MNFAIFVIIV